MKCWDALVGVPQIPSRKMASPMPDRLFGIHETASRLAFVGGVIALAAVVPLYAYEVLMRYAFRAPTLWAADFVSFLLLISTFLVVPMLAKEDSHIAVTILPDILPDPYRSYLLKIGVAAGAIISLWVGYIAAVETIVLYDRASLTMTAIPMPRWILASCVTYGLLNSGLYFLISLFKRG